MTTGEQARVFLAMAICGAATGVLNDLLSVLRRGMILTTIADLLLGIFLAVGVICTGLALACDPFRLYAFAGAAMGWLIYWLSLGTIVRVLTQTLGKLSKKVTN